MDFIQYLKQAITLIFLSKIIERRKAAKSIVFDEVFSKRTNTPSPYVDMADIERRTGNMAVTARGAAALPVGADAMTLTKIEPMPIRLSKVVAGAQLNDLRNLYGDGSENGQALVAAWAEKKIEELMDITDHTRNALCAQAMTGKIDYMMLSDKGHERYQVSYGDGETLTHAPTKKFNAEGATIADVVKTLRAMQKKISDAGCAGEIKFLAGADAFDAIVNLIIALPNDQRMGARIDDNAIIVGGKKIILDDITYSDKNASGATITKNEVAPNKIVACAVDLAELTYCAIDDLEGNLEAVPFFSKIQKIDDPSAVKLITESKPMPLCSAKGFCWATVV